MTSRDRSTLRTRSKSRDRDLLHSTSMASSMNDVLTPFVDPYSGPLSQTLLVVTAPGILPSQLVGHAALMRAHFGLACGTGKP